ncbi:hypothetical protein DFQ12_5498 [Sphingobacterium detergens]|uniref:Uncharacterized protein n=1 Tax=Sphingobacterium detergens TaxID=1145106 RepID=A0A420ADU8_SPHD1|nr:hypothetical protein DFQ12_5498 [Sphingobacterium detergens]
MEKGGREAVNQIFRVIGNRSLTNFVKIFER